MKQVRFLIWILVAVALAGFAYLLLRPATTATASQGRITAQSFGGPFTLVGADGRPFPSSRLAGTPYAIFFGLPIAPTFAR